MSPGSLCLKMPKAGIICISSEVQTPQFQQLTSTAASRNLVNKNQQNLAKYSVEVEIYFKKYFNWSINRCGIILIIMQSSKGVISISSCTLHMNLLLLLHPSCDFYVLHAKLFWRGTVTLVHTACPLRDCRSPTRLVSHSPRLLNKSLKYSKRYRDTDAEICCIPQKAKKTF